MLIKDQVFDSATTEPPAGRDPNLFYHHGGDGPGNITLDQCSFIIRPGHAERWAESVKISTVSDVLFSRCVFDGGVEDCVDIIRCGRVWFFDCDFHAAPCTRRHVTVKAGGVITAFDNCTFLGRTRSRYCVQAGDYSAYNQIHRPAHRGGWFSRCTNQSGNRLARLLYSAPWGQEGTRGDATIHRIPPVAVAILFWLRRKAIIGAARENMTPEQIALRPWEL
jgi:hypothetical protein